MVPSRPQENLSENRSILETASDAAKKILRISLLPATESLKGLVGLLEGKKEKVTKLSDSGSPRADKAKEVAEQSIDQRHALALDVQRTTVA